MSGAADRASGLLIINADDWGRDAQTTDAILECIAAGGVSSVSAMVHMADSDRAAALAREHGVPAGLHLNLAEPFTGDGVPDELKARQARLVRRMGVGRLRLALWVYDPLIRADVNRAVGDQIAAFRQLFGSEPTHFDGHHHLHISPTVLLSPQLPPGARLRRSFTYLPGEKPALNRWIRTARNALIRRRFETTDYFFEVRELHPALGGHGMERKLALSKRAAVEVMTHPVYEDERAVLSDPGWARMLDGLPLGSYAEL